MQKTTSTKTNVNREAFDAYKAAFLKCYPQKTVSIKDAPSKRGEDRRYFIEINGEKGDRSLTLQEIKEATAAFNR